MPQPPNVEPPELDVVEVSWGVCDVCDGVGVVFVGGSGALVHPDTAEGTVVWGMSLDRSFAPEMTLAAPNGSFELRVAGAETDAFRLQARRDGRRSAPVDLLLDEATHEPRTVEHPYGECLEIDPIDELDFGEVSVGALATLELTNRCSEVLSITEAGLRAGNPAFEVIAASVPTTLRADESASIQVRFDGTSRIVYEDVLLLVVDGTETDRFAFNLIARGQ